LSEVGKSDDSIEQLQSDVIRSQDSTDPPLSDFNHKEVPSDHKLSDLKRTDESIAEATEQSLPEMKTRVGSSDMQLSDLSEDQFPTVKPLSDSCGGGEATSLLSEVGRTDDSIEQLQSDITRNRDLTDPPLSDLNKEEVSSNNKLSWLMGTDQSVAEATEQLLSDLKTSEGSSDLQVSDLSREQLPLLKSDSSLSDGSCSLLKSDTCRSLDPSLVFKSDNNCSVASATD